MSEVRFLLPTTAHAYDERVAFYRDALGLAVLRDWDRNADDRGTLLIAAAEALVEVIVGPSYQPDPPSGAQLVLRVDDVDAVFTSLTARGVTVLDPPADRPWGHRMAKVADPAGLPIMLFTPLG